jgi:putative membrane protein
MNTRWMTAVVMVGALVGAPAWLAAQTTTTDKPAAEKSRAADKSADKAADKSADKSADKGKLAAGDRKFVMQTLQHGMAEVELGKLASEKASNDSVKQFGQRMVDDHGKAGDELKKIAQDKGITPPAEMDGKHRKLHDRLSKMSGAEFDRAYVDEMVKDHRNDVKEFQREAKNAKDPDVKSFASKTLPTLQDHLKQAEGLRSQVRTAGKGDRDAGAASGKSDAGKSNAAKGDAAKSDTGKK